MFRFDVERVLKVWGFALATAAFVGWLANMMIDEKMQFSAKFVAVLVGFLALITVAFIVDRCFDKKVQLVAVGQQFISADNIIISNKVEWMSIRTRVSIYYIKEKYERHLLLGTIINIQENGLVQIKIDFDAINVDEAIADSDFKLITTENSRAISSVRIRPAAQV